MACRSTATASLLLTAVAHAEDPATAHLARLANSYDADSYGALSYDDAFLALDGCVPGCDASWLGDGECDVICNVGGDCAFDGGDCFQGWGECYTEPDGRDYRGNVSTTVGGLTCQTWSNQYPHTHTRTHTNYPTSGLGGHNSCRNMDGDNRPWCFTMDEEIRWDYCVVGPPASTCEHALRVPPPPSPAPSSSPPKWPAPVLAHAHTFSAEAAGCAELGAVAWVEGRGVFSVEVFVDGWNTDKVRFIPGSARQFCLPCANTRSQRTRSSLHLLTPHQLITLDFGDLPVEFTTSNACQNVELVESSPTTLTLRPQRFWFHCCRAFVCILRPAVPMLASISISCALVYAA